MEKKRAIELLGAVFIALIFLTSYAAFSSSSTNAGAKTTTTVPVSTYYATSSAQANITSYGQVLEMNVSCGNASAVGSSISGILTAMQRNGSISNFYSSSPGHILVYLGNYTAYAAYQSIAGKLGQSAACVAFSSQASAQLPARITFHVALTKSSFIVPIPSSQRGVTLPVALGTGTGRYVNVSVAALITENGTVYGNMSVTKA